MITLRSQNRIVTVGLFGAVSVVLGVLENFIPLPIPGVRLGLANLGVMMMLYIAGIAPAAGVMLLKICLVSLLSGNLFFRLSLSAPAGLMALLGMCLLFKYLSRYVSAIGLGIAGAALHMLSQLYVINIFYIKGIFYSGIVGWFLLAATATGVLTGIVTAVTVTRLKSLQVS
ncbi:MAG: Gx transporter family protein [Deferribacteraceae bacterium]|nr:Gx transporter family protein [Deferribacteraceae bacterium]